MRPSISVAKHGDQVRKILEGFRMRNPQLFGSVARGDDTENSDLDILVEVPPGTTFYDLARAELELEAVLGCKVEVLTKDSLAPDIAEKAEADLAPIP
jgi:predicted nucleotidyltransferase